MPDPIDPAELELVRKAIKLGCALRGCCEWHRSALERLANRPPFFDFTPQAVRRAVCDYVSETPDAVTQVAERRPEYLERRFYYKVILPVPALKNGLFVELILDDDDAEYPVVVIVNAHEQRR